MNLINIAKAKTLIDKRKRYEYYCECLSYNRFNIMFDRGCPERVDNSQDRYDFKKILLAYCKDEIAKIDKELEQL